MIQVSSITAEPACLARLLLTYTVQTVTGTLIQHLDLHMLIEKILTSINCYLSILSH
jgi:hypothetical protein